MAWSGRQRRFWFVSRAIGAIAIACSAATTSLTWGQTPELPPAPASAPAPNAVPAPATSPTPAGNAATPPVPQPGTGLSLPRVIRSPGARPAAKPGVAATTPTPAPAPTPATSPATPGALSPAALSPAALSPGALPSDGAPLSPARKAFRFYRIEVRVVAVDDAGQETVLGTPVVQTTQSPAGVAVQHPDGRRIEVNVRLAEPTEAADGSTASTSSTVGSASEGVVPAAPSMLEEGVGSQVLPAIPQPPAPTESPRREAAPADVTKPAVAPGAGGKSRTEKFDQLPEKLAKKVTLLAIDEPRRQVIDELARTSGIEIRFDGDIEQQTQAGLAQRVSLDATEQAVQCVLDELIVPVKLDYIVVANAIVIGAPERLKAAPEAYIVKVYSVDDLTQSKVEELQRLAERVQREVAPETWGGALGEGTIRPFPSTHSLVIRQTEVNHQRVVSALERWRAEQHEQR